jgi:xylulose-5-phosphate/fructose-6-phosphate phosphoketolase
MDSFRIFSPDEITSNKLDAALKITHRNFQWDPEVSDKEMWRHRS